MRDIQVYTASNGIEAVKTAKKITPKFNFTGHYDARNGWDRGM